MLRCRTGERIRVCDWLPDDPYPRAMVQAWPDEPGQPVTADQLEQLEDRVMALFERIAAARSVLLPDRAVVLGSDADTVDPGLRLYALASRVPIGPADRYSVLAAPSAAERLAALSDAVDSVAAVIEFQLSE
jgi:Lon protease-like protein